MMSTLNSSKQRRHNRNNINDIVESLDKGSDLGILKFIQNQGSINVTDSKGNTLLHHALLRKDSSRAFFLLCNSCNPNHRNNNNETPLFTAVKLNDIASVELLLKAGSKVSLETQEILVFPVQNDNCGMIDLLVKHGFKCQNTYVGSITELSSTIDPIVECLRCNHTHLLDRLLMIPGVCMQRSLQKCYLDKNFTGCAVLLAKGADPFKTCSVCFRTTTECTTLIEKIFIEFVDRDLIMLCKAIIREYGFSISNSSKNQLISSICYCKGKPDACHSVENRLNVRTGGIFARNKLKFLAILSKLGMCHQNYSSFMQCTLLSDQNASCQIVRSAQKMLASNQVPLGQGIVPTLQFQCRRAIREQLQFGVCDKAEQLPMPEKLKEFLKFPELDLHVLPYKK